MSPSFLADVLYVLLLSHVLQHVAGGGGMDNGSSSNSPNQPVIELIGHYNTNINPDANYCQPPDKIRIFRGNSSPSSALQSNERKLMLCPLPKSDKKATRMFEDNKFLKYCLFEINENRTLCDDKVEPYLTEINRDSAVSCRAEESKKYKLGSEVCFPYVKGEGDSKTYKKGIKGFLDYADQDVENTRKELHSYLLCYNNEKKSTEWAQRLVTPAANLRRSYDTKIEISTDGLDLEGNRFEKMRLAFAEQDKNSPDEMVPQMLVPKEENSYSLWEINTSHYINVAPLWKSLVPLINLINERIALLAHRIKNALSVVTHPSYNKWIRNAAITYLDNEKEILIPNIWTITVNEQNSKSGIIIILHNTPNKSPSLNELCNEPASCDFRKWISTSTTQPFENVAEEYIGYAYCCRTTKFAGQLIESIIDINFEKEITQK